MTIVKFFMWETRHSIADGETLLTILKTLNQTQEVSRVLLGSRTFVPVSWICKKPTAVLHKSTESEIISLDAGLRADGLLLHDLWDKVIEVQLSTNNNSQPNVRAYRKLMLLFIPKPRPRKSQEDMRLIS